MRKERKLGAVKVFLHKNCVLIKTTQFGVNGFFIHFRGQKE